MRIFVVSVLPAPDSPDTRMDWFSPHCRMRVYARTDVAYACGGSLARPSAVAK
jgi:hypothetical protein